MKDKDSLITTYKQKALTSRSLGFNYHILQIMNKKDTNQANLQLLLSVHVELWICNPFEDVKESKSHANGVAF